MKRGRFITFEGPEGCGKSTQARRLVERLAGLGIRAEYTREPGGTPTGEAIRQILQHDAAGEPICAETEVLLFEASRAQLVRHVIEPALERGDWIVCDRFADSTTVYQGAARGLGVDAMQAVNAFAIGHCVPDLTLLLDIAVQEGFERLAARQAGQAKLHDRIEGAGRAFHEAVRAGYLALARREPDRVRRIDASGDEEAVAAAVWKLVEPLCHE